ncbi:MAG: hypothetical protein ACI4DY_04525 [Monoglobaceae bacterium]
MIKKFNSGFTAVLLILTFFVGAFTVPRHQVLAADSDSGRYDEALAVLKAFGVLDDDMEYTADAEVCREDMALYTARLLALTESSVSERFFTDVPADSYGTWAINALTRMGIFSVGEDRLFRPMDTVEANEAYKIITTVLGYENYAAVSGGYPVGYIKAMNSAGLSMNVSDKALFSEIVVLMYEALQAEMYDQTSFGEGNIEMKKSGNTLLSVCRNINFDEGTIETIGSASIVRNGEADDNEAVISGERYTLETEIYMPDYLSKYIKFFYVGKDSEPKTIKYVLPSGRKADIVVNIKDIASVSEKEITYWNDNRRKTQNIDKSLWVYNGRVLETEIEKTLSELNKGNIVIRDSNNDGAYDTVLIWDFRNFVIKSKNDATETVYDKLESGGSLTNQDYKGSWVYDDKQNRLKWFDLSEGMTLSVAKSKDKEALTLIASTMEFNGTLSGITENPLKLMINGEAYEIEPSYLNEFNTKGFQVGNVYLYKLDQFGHISYIYSGQSDSAMKYGYIIDSYVRLDAMFDEIRLRVLTADDKVEEIKLADTVRVDGERYREVQKIAGAFPGFDGAKISPQMIRYETDENGNIKNVDTITLNQKYENADNSMTLIGDDGFGIKWYRSGRFGLKAWIGTDTLLYSIPMKAYSGEPKSGEYMVEKVRTSLRDDGCYYANIYVTAERSEYADLVLRKYEDSNIDKNNGEGIQLMLVDEIGDALDEDGNMVKCMTGMVGGSRVSYNIPSDISIGDIGRGDIVKFRYNIRGEMVPSSTAGEADIITLYDYSRYKGELPEEWSGNTADMTLYTKVNNAAYHDYRAEFQLSYGYAADKSDNVLWWGAKNGNNITEMYRVSDVSISVYDPSLPEGQQIYKGTIDDIDDYKTVGSSCSKIILHTHIGKGKALFAYK